MRYPEESKLQIESGMGLLGVGDRGNGELFNGYRVPVGGKGNEEVLETGGGFGWTTV